MRASYFAKRLGYYRAPEGASITLAGQPCVIRGGIPRQRAVLSDAQYQTSDTFEFQWVEAGTTISQNEARWSRASLTGKFPGFRQRLRETLPPGALVLDAGCGRGAFGYFLFEPLLERMHYLGVDVSAAVDVARDYFRLKRKPAEFMQADISALPVDAGLRFDLVVSLGVLHHTDSVAGSLASLRRVLKPDGQLWFWVYRTQPPMRVLSDAYLRDAIARLPRDRALDELRTLVALGRALSEAGVELDLPEVPLLGVPKGTMDLQRFVFDYLVRVFYRPQLTEKRNVLAAWDWYRPQLAHTLSEDEVRRCCAGAGLDIAWLQVAPSGISVIASPSRS